MRTALSATVVPNLECLDVVCFATARFCFPSRSNKSLSRLSSIWVQTLVSYKPFARSEEGRTLCIGIMSSVGLTQRKMRWKMSRATMFQGAYSDESALLAMARRRSKMASLESCWIYSLCSKKGMSDRFDTRSRRDRPGDSKARLRLRNGSSTRDP